MILAFAGSNPAAPATNFRDYKMMENIVLLSGNANKPLAEKISKSLEIPLAEALVGNFSDGETRVELFQNIRGKDVFIIQPLSYPANQNIMELLIIVDACRRASAKNIVAVMPYFAYARQDKKSASRTPISARLVAEVLEAAGVSRVLTMELHNSAIQGFFNVPVDHLYSKPIFYEYFKSRDFSNFVIVSPDVGGAERARALAKKFNTGLALIDKRRDRPNECAAMRVIGDVKGRSCLIIDDIVDTAGSLVKAVDALLGEGAKGVSAAITHPVLSGKAVENIAQSRLKELVVTDSISLTPEARALPQIKQLEISKLFAEAISRVYRQSSVSSLFI